MKLRITDGVRKAPPRRLHRAFTGQAWACTEEKLREMVAVVEHRLAGGSADPDFEPTEPRAADAVPVGSNKKVIACIPVFGLIGQRMDMFMSFSGGTSTESLTADIREAVANEQVAAIVLDVDSPGGSVYGVEELAAVIREARAEKPIVAVVNSMAASAAYWIASQAERVFVTPSGDVGSIGVFMVHTEFSKLNEEAGITHTIIRAGEFKVELNSVEPLTDAARAYEQSRVDEYYERFLSDVALGRGVEDEQVRNDFGRGRMLSSRDAVDAGMADGVRTFDQAIAEVSAEIAAMDGAARRRAADAEIRLRRRRRDSRINNAASAARKETR